MHARFRDVGDEKTEAQMQTLAQGYRGLGLLISINKDWLLSVVTILAALALGASLGRMLM